MTIGARELVGVAIVIALFLKMYLAGRSYSKALNTRGREGLASFDENVGRRYAERPWRFITEAALTRGWKFTFERQGDDEQLERERRRYVMWLTLLVSSSFVLPATCSVIP